MILDKYNNQLPSISEQKFNDYIKEVCQLAGIDSQVEVINTSKGNKRYDYVPKWQVVTSHIAVKTFITLCGEKGISPLKVSAVTGKSVNILIKHYYGIDKESIQSNFEQAFN
jgi:hypothetical protein